MTSSSGPAADDSLSDLFRALANSTRRRILVFAMSEEFTVTSAVLSGQFGISTQALSRHIHLLERCGLLAATKSGRTRLYAVTSSALEPALEWLKCTI